MLFFITINILIIKLIFHEFLIFSYLRFQCRIFRNLGAVVALFNYCSFTQFTYHLKVVASHSQDLQCKAAPRLGCFWNQVIIRCATLDPFPPAFITSSSSEFANYFSLLTYFHIQVFHDCNFLRWCYPA